MKTLRTLGIIVAVALAAIGLAVLPSTEDVTEARPGISVGETSAPERDGGSTPAGSAPTGVVPSADGAVTLPVPTASEQPVRGMHTDTGVGAMEPEASPEPQPAPEPAPKPTPQPRSSGGSDSSSGSSSSGSSSGGSKSTPQRPDGVCEWDDGELDCEDDDSDDDDDDDGEDDD